MVRDDVSDQRGRRAPGVGPDTVRRRVDAGRVDAGRLATRRDEHGHRTVAGADLAAVAVTRSTNVVVEIADPARAASQ